MDGVVFRDTLALLLDISKQSKVKIVITTLSTSIYLSATTSTCLISTINIFYVFGNIQPIRSHLLKGIYTLSHVLSHRHSLSSIYSKVKFNQNEHLESRSFCAHFTHMQTFTLSIRSFCFGFSFIYTLISNSLSLFLFF